jgi:hypothetical protein
MFITFMSYKDEFFLVGGDVPVNCDVFVVILLILNHNG